MPPAAWLPWHLPTVPIKAAISLQCVAWSFQIPYVPVNAKAFGATMSQVRAGHRPAPSAGLHRRPPPTSPHAVLLHRYPMSPVVIRHVPPLGCWHQGDGPGRWPCPTSGSWSGGRETEVEQSRVCPVALSRALARFPPPPPPEITGAQNNLVGMHIPHTTQWHPHAQSPA